MTQKRIFILLAILLASILLAACGLPDVKQADPETQEIQIKTWAYDGGSTRLTVTLANGEEVTATASSFIWYYDVPVNQTEYLVVGSSYFLHLWETKAPSE